MTEPCDGLSISELASRTGVPAPTLRSWEERYGFPRPCRLPGGHRRYEPGDIAVIEMVIRLRATGMQLAAAISHCTAQSDQAEPSIFAGLRRRHPALTPQVLRKSTLLALSRAIEDECCAQAVRPAIFASFQRERFFRQSEKRWNELARTSRFVIVFADFAESYAERTAAGERSQAESALVKVPLARDASARREWTLVCESTEYSACLASWEFPGQQETTDSGRRFEVIWSLEPRVVRSAATICGQLARSIRPDLDHLLRAMPEEPPEPASADLRRATSLLSRMTNYLDNADRR